MTREKLTKNCVELLENKIHLVSFFFLFILLAKLDTFNYLSKFLLSILILMAYIIKGSVNKASFWFMTLLLHLVSNLYEKGFYGMSNYNFIVIYTLSSMWLTMSLEKDKREGVLSKNFHYIFLILMFFAAIHKILWSNFYTGALVYKHFLLGKGNAGAIVNWIYSLVVDNYEEITKLNRSLLTEFKTSLVAKSSRIELKPIVEGAVPFLFKGISILIILLELFFVILFAFSKRSKLKHTTFLIGIWSIFLYRPGESNFLAWVTVISFYLCPKYLLKTNMTYIGTIMIFVSYFIAT